MTELCHYTISSGHARQSPRTEVADDVLELLRPLLASGDHEIPGLPDYRLRVTASDDVFAATVFRLTRRGPAPLVTMMVCGTENGLAIALRSTGCKPAVPLSLPCALVDVHETIALDTSATEWLGDFERCLAWAWLERSG